MNQFFKLLFFLSVQIIASQTIYCLPKLSSYPSATATIFLDFDGNYVEASAWNMGEPINCLPSGMTDAQITEVFNRVAEDYRPFDINITTDSLVFLSAPLTNRIRIIVTPTSDWLQGVGGIAYTGSFIWGDDTPAFVFCDRLGPNNSKMVAEACTHESGHTLGLSHQSRYDAGCNLTEMYNSGVGTGQTSWAPVMGNSYYRNMTGWDNGPTQFDCTYKQDNLSLITTQNGFSFRIDDYDEYLNTKTFSITPSNIHINGIITTPTDKDAFKIVLPQRNSLYIQAKPFSVGANDNGANLDIKLLLYNASAQLIQTYNPSEMMSVSIDTILNSGTYFLIIDGAGNKNAQDYGSLGSYTITGNTGTVLPIQDIKLIGITENGKHNLSWKIISSDQIKSVGVEFSTNGINYNTLSSVTVSNKSLSYIPQDEPTLYYRVKATSISEQVVYSNVIILKSTTIKANGVVIPTIVKEEVIITAKESYLYLLSDMSGRKISSGKGYVGINKIVIANLPLGMYVITVVTQNERFTQRVVKQ